MKSTRRIVCVASALVAGIFSASAGWGAYSKELKSQQDFSKGSVNCVSFSGKLGGLVLSESINNVPFLWVPSPDSNTVSKMDGRTGQEIARYKIGTPDEPWTPCAVVSDNDGNAYVACSCYGSTGKVVKISMSDGIDRNGDGLITTSNDCNGDGMISPAEVLPWGKDERVTDVYEVGDVDSTPSSLIFDNNGGLWVMLWGERSAAKISLVTNKVVDKVTLMGKPSIAVKDLNGMIWILSRDSKTLCQLNPVTDTLGDVYKLEDIEPSGMCIDQGDKIWISSSNGGMVTFQPQSGAMEKLDIDENLTFSSVTVDKKNNIWASCSTDDLVAHISGDDGTLLSTVPVGPNPGTISTDSDGYIWTLNEGNCSASRVNADEEECVFTTPIVAGTPFSNTSFAAAVVKRGIAPSGTWETVFDSTVNGAGWDKISWLSDECAGKVKIEARSADSTDKLVASHYVPAQNGKSISLPQGRYLQLKVTLDGSLGSTPVLKDLMIEGANLAPDVSKAMPTVAIINKNDHTMESVGISGVVDPEGDPMSIEIVKVTQNEPTAGINANDKPVDAMGIGAARVWLRGECDPNGRGRMYVVAFRATDQYGASSFGKVKVMVPNGNTMSEIALSDAQKYDSTLDPNMRLVASR